MKLKELQRQMKNQNEAQHINLAVLSNITLEPYFQQMINNAFAKTNVFVRVIPLDYAEFLSSRTTEQISEADIIALIPNFERFYPEICNKNLNLDEIQVLINSEISNMRNVISMIKSKLNASIILFGYEDYCYKIYNAIGNSIVQNGLVDKLNMNIVSRVESNIVYVDIKRLIANVGIANAYDIKNKYRWNSPYNQAMIEQICNEIHKQVSDCT